MIGRKIRVKFRLRGPTTDRWTRLASRQPVNEVFGADPNSLPATAVDMAVKRVHCNGSYKSQASVFLSLLAATIVGQTMAEPSKRLVGFSTVNQYLSMCLQGQNHKRAPSYESQLHGECQSYQGNSCCTALTASDLHRNETWYRLRREHCGTTKMSPGCRSYFDKDLCFYECSPDIGPWLEQDNRRWRQEKMANVPICRSQCEQWFGSCARDYTCADNWYTGFQWKDGQNVCADERNCTTFQEIFKDAKTFCEKIWDGSYKVVDDGQPCMRFPTNPQEATSNTDVARDRANELLWQQRGPTGGTRANSVRHLVLAIFACGLFSLSYLA